MNKYFLLAFIILLLAPVFKRFMSSAPHPYHKELIVALLAVKRASSLTKALSNHIATTRQLGTQIKDDKSPVTIGDYAAQAIVNHALKLNFPHDEIVGEEDLAELKLDPKLSLQVIDLIKKHQAEDSWGDVLGQLTTEEEVFNAIDFGDSKGGATGRFWALDPIDGTKGFLRGDQFAVCLALIDQGKVVLGVIGSPNLPAHIISNTELLGTVGGLYSAIKGVGSYVTDLFTSEAPPSLVNQRKIEMKNTTDPSKLVVCEGVEKGHSDHLEQAQIKKLLDIPSNNTINLDSQVKYCVLAKGEADIYLRLPISETYREKIWDHAAGNILITEAGGRVGDVNGVALDFSKGRLLQSQGVIAANSAIFDDVIKAVQEVRNKK